jgi:hypothetical protein
MTPSLMASGFVLALIGCVLVVFSRFNTLVRSQKRVQEAWSGIDVQLRQRASLIPNLVEAIRGYAEHEREVFEDGAWRVAQGRQRWSGRRGEQPAEAGARARLRRGRSLPAVARLRELQCVRARDRASMIEHSECPKLFARPSSGPRQRAG